MSTLGGAPSAVWQRPPCPQHPSGFVSTFVRSGRERCGVRVAGPTPLFRVSGAAAIGAALLVVAILSVVPQAALAQLQTYGLNQTNIFTINTTTGAATSVRVLTGPNKAALGQRASDGVIF